MKQIEINFANDLYPEKCRQRLSGDAPIQFSTLGNLNLLGLSKTAFFCSTRSPGSVVLTAYDQAASWRESGRCIISGFHSPIEKECLQILLRGLQPIIICPARSLPQRVPLEWKDPIGKGRLLILSGFHAAEKRITSELAVRRNELVAALADEACFAHVNPGGHAERLTHRLIDWQMPFTILEKGHAQDLLTAV